MAVSVIPAIEEVLELLTLCMRADGHDLEEDPSKVLSIGSRGMASTPAESLALNMHQTSLGDERWPDSSCGTKNMPISVHGGAFGFQALFFETSTELQQVPRALVDVIGTTQDLMRQTIHHSIQSSWTMEKCAIEDHVATRWIDEGPRWWSLEPIVHNALNRRPTVTTEGNELPNRVALDDPSTEPDKLALVAHPSCRPTEGVSTPKAQPSLLPVAESAVAFDSAR